MRYLLAIFATESPVPSYGPAIVGLLVAFVAAITSARS